MSSLPEASHPRDARAWGFAALLGLALVVAYTPALQAGFIWDDDVYVTENDTLRSVGGLARIWLQPSSIPQYYPVVHTSFWLEYRLWGLEPFGYHAVNLLLHFAASLLAWRLLRRLEVPGAMLAAAIFALHPVQVESVAWVTERKNLLSGVFYLAAFLAWLRFDPPEDDGRTRHWPAYRACAVLFLLALLSKTVTASLPAAIAVVLWWKRGRLEPARLAPLLPLLGVGAGLGLVTAWLETSHVGASGEEWALSFAGRCIVAGRALWFYAAKLAWPADLSFIYPRWEIDPAVASQWLWPLAALALAALLLAMRGRIGRGPLAAALLFAGTLFPALGFLDVYPHRFSYVADHFQYLASLAPIALFAAVAARLAHRWPRPVMLAASLLLCAALGARGFAQAQHYHDRESLWRATIVTNPHSFLAQTSLGNIYWRRGEWARAMPHYRVAVEIRPGDVASVNNLAWALATAGDASLRDGPQALRLALQAGEATEFAAAQILDTLAAAYAEVGRYAEAAQVARRGAAAARQSGDPVLERALRQRSARYQRGLPYREVAPPPDPATAAGSPRSNTSR